MDLAETMFIVIKGFIDAKDDRGKPIYGSFVALASRKDVRYLSVCVLRREIPKDIAWSNLLTLHSKRSEEADRLAENERAEELIHDFLYSGDVLNQVAKNHNTKTAEQAISRFCLDQLELKAVSFIEFMDATHSDVAYFDKLSGKNEAEQPSEEQQEEAPSDAAPVTLGGKPNEIFVRCEPVLDPIGGVAMNEVQVGNIVCAKLPPDSVFYKLMAKTNRYFDGLITAEVTGMLVNDLGTSTISLKLSDDVSGVMKMSGKVRIKLASFGTAGDEAAEYRKISLAPEVVIGIGVFFLLVAALLAIYYILLD